MISLELLMRICGIEAVVLILAVALVCGHALWLWREQRWSWPQLIRGWAVLGATLDGPVPPPADLKWLGSLPVRLQIRLFTSILVSLTGLGRERITHVARIIGLLRRVGIHAHLAARSPSAGARPGGRVGSRTSASRDH